MLLSRLFEESWTCRGWKHHDRRPWPRHQNDTVHSMLSVTIESGCVPRMCVSMCASVCVRRLWITLSPVWRPQHPQTSHSVTSSCWNAWRKTILDNRLVPTFYNLTLGRCPRQHSLLIYKSFTYLSLYRFIIKEEKTNMSFGAMKDWKLKLRDLHACPGERVLEPA